MKIAVLGAGLIGCYLGGMFRVAGHQVSLIGRSSFLDGLKQDYALTIKNLEGKLWRPSGFELMEDLGDQNWDLLFVTLKCHHLEPSWPQIKRAMLRSRCSVFLQNGLGSLEPFADELGKLDYRTGIVAFNVVRPSPDYFQQTSEGGLHCAQHPLLDELAIDMKKAGFEMVNHEEIEAVHYGKLIMNLNNALNAIEDIPLKQQLELRASRKQLSAAIKELLAICKRLDIKPFQFTAVSPGLLPYVLVVPNFIFKLLAQKMLSIDPKARSSMWEDIQSKRKTEIEYINGAVVSLGRQLKIPTPVNESIVDRVRAIESRYLGEPV